MTERRHVLGLLAAASFLSISPVRAGIYPEAQAIWD